MQEYTAVIRVAVNTNLKQSVQQQLNSVVLPSGNEIEWTKGDQPNPAAAAIAYALDGGNHDYDSETMLNFLENWNEGEFDVLRDNWDNIPDEVFIGADPQFKPSSIKSEYIPFVLDARTLKPVKLSELEEYSFCNEDEDLYLHEVVVRVSQDALDESKEIANAIPDNFTNDLQLLKLIESSTFNLHEFKSLSLWSQDALEYDQAVLLSLLLPTYVRSK